MHTEVIDLVGSNDPEGLLVHLVYETEQGFNMVEVWKSKEWLMMSLTGPQELVQG